MKLEKCAFGAIEFILYLAFVSADLFRVPWEKYSDVLKYIALGICLVYALALYNRKRHAGSGAGWSVGILAAAMCADYFLLFTQRFVPGILLFAVVQGCYRVSFLRLTDRTAGSLLDAASLAERNAKSTDKQQVTGMQRRVKYRAEKNTELSGWKTALCQMYAIGIAVALLVAFVSIAFLEQPADSNLLTTCTAVFYACCLLQNVILGIRLSTQTREVKKGSTAGLHVLTAAILLLLLCDIHVGICNVDGIGLLSSYQHTAAVLMWVFYLPSQLCVVESIGKNTEIEANFGN